MAKETKPRKETKLLKGCKTKQLANAETKQLNSFYLKRSSPYRVAFFVCIRDASRGRRTTQGPD